jgi:glyoxylase I family protein
MLKYKKNKTRRFIMILNSIHHIAIIASNYELSKNFYVNILGFQIIRENYRKDRDSYKLDLKIGNSEIELFSMSKAPKRPSYPEACGLRHLAFRVKNIEDAIKELNSNGIKTEPIRIDEYTGEKFTFFSDPDGLPLELHE